MASDGPPGTEPIPSDLGSSVAALNTWTNPELQAKLGELGAPNMGKKPKSEQQALNGTNACIVCS